MSHDTGIHPMITMENFILKIDDALSDDLCDLCLNYYDDKKAQCYDDPFNYVQAQEMEIKDGVIMSKLDQAFFRIVKFYMDKFPTFRCQYDSGISLRKIFGATKKHTDGIVSSTPTPLNQIGERVSSLIIGLNSDYEEGVFNFPQQGCQTRVERGQAILFPPFWTHPHEVSAPVNGFRYTLNTWLVQDMHLPFIPKGTHES